MRAWNTCHRRLWRFGTKKIVVKDEVFELDDKKDLALLQEKIYVELSQMEPRTEDEQTSIAKLGPQFFDITKVGAGRVWD